MANVSPSHDTLDTRLAALGITVLERGWLSANSIVMVADAGSLVVDTGYATHADQTVALIRQTLEGRQLDRIVNTHLHSDHCGGNAALLEAWPAARICIPPGQAAAVRHWDPVALTYVPTGQICPRFDYNNLIRPGDRLSVGGLSWEAHAALGHDPHAIVLHEPDQRILISGDALWNNGFGVVFPELDGANAFDEVADTLDLIEALAPSTVIPGHGPVFQGAEVAAAMARARSRLLQFQRDPAKHRRHALKVLIKFKMLELQRIERDSLQTWFGSSDYFVRIARVDHPQLPSEVFDSLLKELEAAAALAVQGNWILNQ
jgi:glyoxylase-like metal-dependent hydrolase (beta-lactamase superfamily II)